MRNFVFDPDYTFEWPVTVKYPGANGDVEATFTGVFKLPEDELEIFASAEVQTISDVIGTVRARLAKHWVGWSGIETPDGAQLPYSDEAKLRLLQQRPIREAVDRAFSEGAFGIREKN